jgi:peptide/nickel transport system permease protein
VADFIVRRLAYSVVALAGVITIVFFLLHMTGDPVSLLLPPEATKQDMESIRHAYGFDKPLVVQYSLYWSRLLHGDLGYSYRQSLPVVGLLEDRVRATLTLAMAGLVVAVVLGVSLGTVAATHSGSTLDTMAMLGSLIGTSVPSFWLGLILFILFGVLLKWLPISGYGGLSHLIMPSFCLGVVYAAQISRLTRTNLLGVLAQDYVRTAKAKGLAHRAIILRHALKNATIPVLTIVGLSFGRMLGGAVIVESIFAWPGLGRLAVQSVLARDFPVVQGVVILAAAIFLAANLIVDLLYEWIDPRLRTRTSRA